MTELAQESVAAETQQRLAAEEAKETKNTTVEPVTIETKTTAECTTDIEKDVSTEAVQTTTTQVEVQEKVAEDVVVEETEAIPKLERSEATESAIFEKMVLERMQEKYREEAEAKRIEASKTPRIEVDPPSAEKSRPTTPKTRTATTTPRSTSQTPRSSSQTPRTATTTPRSTSQTPRSTATTPRTATSATPRSVQHSDEEEEEDAREYSRGETTEASESGSVVHESEMSDHSASVDYESGTEDEQSKKVCLHCWELRLIL